MLPSPKMEVVRQQRALSSQPRCQDLIEPEKEDFRRTFEEDWGRNRTIADCSRAPGQNQICGRKILGQRLGGPCLLVPEHSFSYQPMGPPALHVFLFPLLPATPSHPKLQHPSLFLQEAHFGPQMSEALSQCFQPKLSQQLSQLRFQQSFVHGFSFLSQPRSENIKWKIPEVNNPYIKNNFCCNILL